MLKHSEDYVIPDVSNTPESNSVTVP